MSRCLALLLWPALVLSAFGSNGRTAFAVSLEGPIELQVVNEAGQPEEKPKDGQLRVGDVTHLSATPPDDLVSGASYEVRKPVEPEPAQVGDSPEKKVEGLPPFLADVSVRSDTFFVKVEWLRFGDWSLDGYELWQVEPERRRIGALTSPKFRVFTAISKDDEKPAEPYPMLGPVSLGLPAWVALALFFLAGAVLVMLLAYLIRWNRNRKPPAPVQVARPKAPIDELALSWLHDLERQALWENGDLKRHYFRLSEIAKTYLGERFSVDALESTTRELMEALERGKSLEDAKLDAMEKLFSELDLVKFTDLKPGPDAPKRHIDEVKKLVLSTRLGRSP